jgi:hypothetical protein
MNIYSKIAIIALIMLMITACENPFNPSSNDVNTSTDFTPNDEPTDLLRNLEDSYRQKNLDLYKYCLAEDFRFQLISTEVSDIGIDLDNDGFADDEWGFQEEIQYHENLFESGSSDGQYPPPDQIDLSFGGEPIIDDDTEDGHEGWKILSSYFTLNLRFDDGSNLSALGYVRFYLKPIDGEWKIAIWRDESNIY